METYVLKSIGCLFILYTFYRLFLENEKAHNFKRIFLISILVFSFTLPVITIKYGTELISASNLDPKTIQNTIIEDAEASNTPFNFSIIFLLIYVIGVLGLLVRFLRNILKLRTTIKNNINETNNFSTLVLLPFRTIPYSYFQYIFLEKERYLKGEIPREVIKHEEAHVKQRHTIDIFILEILQIIFWFNPLFYFLKRSMRLNHEFLADEAVLKNQSDPISYSNLIINSSREVHQLSLTSPFKHSLIKKRIIMISNQFSQKLFLSKVGLLIPVLCLCVYFFNNDIIAKTIIDPETTESGMIQQDYLFFIEVVGETIKLDGEEVRLRNFTEKLDNITSEYSEDEIRNKNIRLHFSNIPEEFAIELNKEFKKSRYFKLNPSDDGLFPPTPPAPSGPNDKTPEPPKKPKADTLQIPEVPEAPKEPVIIEVREAPQQPEEPEAPKEPVIAEVREAPQQPEGPEEPVIIEAWKEREFLHQKSIKIREEQLQKREKILELREKELEKRQLEFEKRKQKISNERKYNKKQGN